MKIMHKIKVSKFYIENDNEEEIFTMKFNNHEDIIDFAISYFDINLMDYLFTIGIDDYLTTLWIENNDNMVLFLSISDFIAEDTEVADEYDDEESSEYKIVKK